MTDVAALEAAEQLSRRIIRNLNVIAAFIRNASALLVS